MPYTAKLGCLALVFVAACATEESSTELESTIEVEAEDLCETGEYCTEGSAEPGVDIGGDGCDDKRGTAWAASVLPAWFSGICIGAQSSAMSNTPSCDPGCVEASSSSGNNGAVWHFGSDWCSCVKKPWGSHAYCEGWGVRVCVPAPKKAPATTTTSTTGS